MDTMDIDNPTGSFESILLDEGMSWTNIQLGNGLKSSVVAAWGSAGTTSEVAEEQMKKLFQGMADAYMEFNYKWEANIGDLVFQSEFLRAVKEKVCWVRRLSNRELGRLTFNFMEARKHCLKQRQEDKFHSTTEDSEIALHVQQFMDIFNHRANKEGQLLRAGAKTHSTEDSQVIPFDCAKSFIINKEDAARRSNSTNYSTGQHYVSSSKGPFLVPQRRKSSRPLKKEESKDQKDQEDQKDQDVDSPSNLVLRPKRDEN
ncbi:hypothetical protein K445DRAFT_26479 [Daldinia sp. EC12]|nr:hypothetical protein K445DRAFT_26479 [Daldinia sp. EC12]